jgi:diguanylate cyclase (GGDEF)-like protein/PAS domain S-box-containing protein
MENTLLDILILGLLVLVFGSIYRTRPSSRLRYWIIGWFFILLHFAVLLDNPAGAFWSAIESVVVLGTLTLSGVAFLMAAIRVKLGVPRGLRTVALFAVPALAYILLTQFGVRHRGLLLAIVLVQAAATMLATWTLWRLHRGVMRLSAACVALCAAWAAYLVLHGEIEAGVYPMFTQIYAMNAVLYWQDFRRSTVGVVMAIGGLIAWAAVFPCALALAALAPQLQYSGEIWNLPKYFVEFGMILTLMEDSILAARLQREEYRLLFDNNPHPMWIFDEQTLRFLKVNEAAVMHYGYSAEEFSRMTLPQLRPADELLRFEHRLKEASGNATRSGPWTHIKSDGARIKVEIASHAIQFDGRKARFALVQDVTERQELHDRLVHQANHDILTGLPNRLLLKDRMERTLAGSLRNGEKAAVICLDLDRFKQINDRYGHHIGDMCLKHLADLLRQRLRAADTVARSGGEEFTVLLGGLAAAEDAARVVQSLVHAIRQPFEIEGYHLEISASLGIAIYPDDGAEAQSLWRAADVAMYRAKKSGGNQFVFVSNEISTAASEVNEIEACLRTALKDGALEVNYQPQYAIDGPLCGLEALLRLRHPAMGMIPPERFIPVAEECGLIVRIGEWILEEVCRQTAAWKAQGLPCVRVALNISPLQLMRADFSTRVREILVENSMDPRLLEIEITETTMMRNLEDVARQMRELGGAGVRFSVDDFGSGYSSLRHLHQLPIATLKIDQSFIARICEEDGTREIVHAILSLAHSLGMQVIAEGVERQDQVDLLRVMRCDQVQGFLWGRPQTAEAIPALLLGQPARFGPESQPTHPAAHLQTQAG